MQPRTKYYLSLLGFSVAGILFVGIGIYLLIFLRGNHSSPNLFAALGSVFLGLLFFKEVAKWVRLPKEVTKRPAVMCPQCGALIKENATYCEK